MMTNDTAKSCLNTMYFNGIFSKGRQRQIVKNSVGHYFRKKGTQTVCIAPNLQEKSWRSFLCANKKTSEEIIPDNGKIKSKEETKIEAQEIEQGIR